MKNKKVIIGLILFAGSGYYIWKKSFWNKKSKIDVSTLNITEKPLPPSPVKEPVAETTQIVDPLPPNYTPPVLDKILNTSVVSTEGTPSTYNSSKGFTNTGSEPQKPSWSGNYTGEMVKMKDGSKWVWIPSMGWQKA